MRSAGDLQRTYSDPVDGEDLARVDQAQATPLERCWYPVAWSVQLRSKPLAAELLGREIVIFRDQNQKATVLDNRCPHRGVQLSRGRLIDGCLECPYHGWQFDAEGRCIRIPSLAEGARINPQITVRKWLVREEQGTVWACSSQDPIQPDPPRWHHFEHSSFLTVIDVACSYIEVMENLVDNPHAGFIHAGLLRGRPGRMVQAEITETSSGVHIHTKGERPRRSILYRIFGRPEAEIYHTEEYVHPNIIRTVFASGATHVSSQFNCVPVAEGKTRVFYRIAASLPIEQRPFFPLLKLIARRILHQDKLMLEHAHKQAYSRGRGLRFSVAADIPAIRVIRAAQQFSELGMDQTHSPRTRHIRYTL